MKKRKQRRVKPKAVPKAGQEKLDPPLVMRKLPDVQLLERMLLLYSPVRGEHLPPDIETSVWQISRRLFGITRGDTLFRVPKRFWKEELTWEEDYELKDLHACHERRYDTSGLYDDEAAAALQKYGIDFTDDRGLPLRCTEMLCRQAEAVFKGFAGHLPDRALIDLEQWSDSLDAEAQKFIASKRRRAPGGQDVA